jgi:agmatine deiminase
MMTVTTNKLTVAQQGFRFPAEWQPHAATFTGWPFDDGYWEGHLDVARADFARLITTIAQFEPVYVVCTNAEVRQSAETALRQVTTPYDIMLLELQVDDTWLRDSGPLWVRNQEGQLLATDWRFNAWGGKYRWKHDQHVAKALAEKMKTPAISIDCVMEGGALDINSQGVCLTTRQCLLNPNRNPELNQTQIETYLKDNLGVTGFIWLNEGLEGDKTDGHVDTITRWVSDTTIITSVSEDPADSNYAPMQENLEILRSCYQPDGSPYTIIELPLPCKRMYSSDERLPLTYANFYIGNGFVAMPTYNDANDARASAILQAAFPQHKVLPLPSEGLITGGGSFHCVTQQLPIGGTDV